MRNRLLLPVAPGYRLLVWGAAIAIVLSLGLFRSISEAEYALASAVLVPIVGVTWISGRRGGFVLTAIGMAAWIIADLVSGRHFSASWIPFANGATRLATYSFVVIVVASLHEGLLRERELASHDPLTGLLNRREFDDRGTAEVERSRRYGHPVAVAFIDLDNFKQINDRLGHAVGDKVLQSVASALHDSSRASDLVGRIGGDEFAVLLPELDRAAAHDLGTRIASGLGSALAPFSPVSASIGIAWFAAADVDFPSMLCAADALMYQIKSAGKNDVQVRYHPD
jgi:diguanylate cyclase (GGDEF)-like protein